MTRSFIWVALLMIGVGGLWILQGLGYVGGSFMTGDRQWTWIGFATAAAGIVLLASRGRPR